MKADRHYARSRRGDWAPSHCADMSTKKQQRPLAETPSREPASGEAVDRDSVLGLPTSLDPDAVRTLFALGLGPWCIPLNGKVALSKGWPQL